MRKRNAKYYARILGAFLLLPGPLLCIFEYAAVFLFWIATIFAILHVTAMPQSIPSLPYPLCETPLFYYLGIIDIVGCFFLFYGLFEKKKSKKSNLIWVIILLISFLLGALFMTMLGLLAACLTF